MRSTLATLPTDEQKLLEKLRDRYKRGELTEIGHEELIHYEDQLEQLRVGFLEALMELERLKNIDLLTLNRQFQ